MGRVHYRSANRAAIFWIFPSIFRPLSNLRLPGAARACLEWIETTGAGTGVQVYLMLSFLLRGSRGAVFLKAFLMIGVIAFVDWRVEKDLPLGFLYLFPMLLVGSVLSRWQIVAVAGCCTFLTEVFDSFEWHPESGVPRDILIFAAFAGMGLFVYEIVRSRQVTLQHLNLIQNESEARRAAEEQLQVLV